MYNELHTDTARTGRFAATQLRSHARRPRVHTELYGNIPARFSRSLFLFSEILCLASFWTLMITATYRRNFAFSPMVIPAPNDPTVFD